MKTTFCYLIDEKAERILGEDGTCEPAYLKIIIKSLGKITPEEYSIVHKELTTFVEYVTKIELKYISPIDKLVFLKNVNENNLMEIREVAEDDY